MNQGLDIISKNEIKINYLLQIEEDMNFIFPNKFKKFVSNYTFSSNAIVLEMAKDELRGFEFSVEVVLFGPTKNEPSPLYFESFRDLEDIADELKTIDKDDLWINQGLLVIGYSTVGEKICLGVKEQCADEIWRVNDDAIPENKYKYLASDIYEFVEGLISKRASN